MADKRFNIVFSGKLAQGAQPLDVLQKSCLILGLAEPRVRELFKPGAGAVIAADLEGAAAYTLRDKLLRAGVFCTVQELAAPAAPIPAAPAPLEPLPLGEWQATEPLGQRPPQRPPRPRPRPSAPPPRQPQGAGIIAGLFKLACLAALGYAGWFGYQSWFAPPTPAYVAYERYAEALARGEYQKAADQSQGGARSVAEQWVQMTRPSSIKVYGRELNTSPPSVASIAGEISWIKRKRKAERQKSAALVELQVEQTVCRIPPGVSSALCKWPVTFEHQVEVEQVDGVWKVAEFKEERLTPQDK